MKHFGELKELKEISGYSWIVLFIIFGLFFVAGMATEYVVLIRDTPVTVQKYRFHHKCSDGTDVDYIATGKLNAMVICNEIPEG